MSWFTLKAKLYALGGLLLAALAFVARFMVVKAQRDKFRERANHFEAKEAQRKIEKASRERRRQEQIEKENEAESELANGEIPSILKDRNDF